MNIVPRDYDGLDGLRLGELVLDPAFAVLVRRDVKVVADTVARYVVKDFLTTDLAAACCDGRF